MNIAELQIEVHAINVAKGWHTAPLCARRAEECGRCRGARQREPAFLHICPDCNSCGQIGPSDVDTNAVLAKLALVHSELCEAEEEAAADLFDVYYRDDKPTKPEGWIVEIADALTRVLDTCEALGLEFAVDGPRYRTDTSLHAYVSRAVEAARVGDYTGAFVEALVGLWHACEIEADRLRLDLAHAIKLKIAYNRTRPHRHGGKRA